MLLMLLQRLLNSSTEAREGAPLEEDVTSKSKRDHSVMLAPSVPTLKVPPQLRSAACRRESAAARSSREVCCDSAAGRRGACCVLTTGDLTCLAPPATHAHP